MRGFSTVEMLIAFTIMTLGLSSAAMVAFGNQSLTIDTELENRALYLAERTLEEARADGVADFASLVSWLGALDEGLMYKKNITVVDTSECVKEVKSVVSWQVGSKSTTTTSLSTIVASSGVSEALGHDCATQKLADEWDNPTSYGFGDLIQGGSQATDVDVVSTSNDDAIYSIITSTLTSSSTLWVADATNPSSPTLLEGFADGNDYNEVDAYMDEDTGVVYAFIASASSTAALQVVRIEFTGAPGNPVNFSRTSYNLGISGSCNGQNNFCPTATAIKYFDGRVYVGTHRTNGHEFYVFNETSPGVLALAMSKEINHNVNEIGISNGWAYVATSDNSGEIIALNVSGASIPNFDTTKFNAPGDSDGLSLHVTDQYTFLGRVRDSAEADFFILRNSGIRDVASIQDGIVAAVDMDDATCTYKNEGAIKTTDCLSSGDEVRDIITSGPLAFIVTNAQNATFQVWNIDDISAPAPHKPETGCSTYKFPAKPTSLDQHNNLVYASIESNLGLRIIYDQPGQCVE